MKGEKGQRHGHWYGHGQRKGRHRKEWKEESAQNFYHSAVFKTKVLAIQREIQALKQFQKTSRYKTCFAVVQT